jgi:hypothetical protein
MFLARMCDFIPVTEANELKFDLASISRMHKIVNDLAPARIGEKGYFDIASLEVGGGHGIGNGFCADKPPRTPLMRCRAGREVMT